MQTSMLQLIRWYQKYLAWLNGPNRCRFSPRCSQYCYESIAKHGVAKGGWMGIVRISRCHPWGKFGYNPVN